MINIYVYIIFYSFNFYAYGIIMYVLIYTCANILVFYFSNDKNHTCTCIDLRLKQNRATAFYFYVDASLIGACAMAHL